MSRFSIMNGTVKNKSFRFQAEDPNSGRREHLISRNTMLDVSDLTMASIRVSDPRVASVMDGVIQGHTPGSADIQVLRNTKYDYY